VTEPDTRLSDSGGTMVRLTGTASPRPVDLEPLADIRLAETDQPWSAAGAAPFLPAGDVVQWRYGTRCDPMRVVRDNERGLVAWLAADTELLASAPDDGVALRDRPLAERFLGARVPTLGLWRGGGILRIAPTGRPWSIWVFREDDGSLAGHYVNLELPHRRHGDETNTRDLVLDLWLDPDGTLWLKDADELDAAVQVERITAEQAAEIRAIAEWARAELIEGRDWPLDDEWTTWQPPADWETPPLPDTPLVREARRTTLPG
jgi:predicted RNA-binding protein associated with RNAse of E/G family